MRRRDFVRSTLAATACAVAPWDALRAQGNAAAGAATRAAAAGGADSPALSVSDGTGPIDAIGLSGKHISLARADVDELGANLRGQLILPGDAPYDEARRVWNGAFDRHPALIARCAGAADKEGRVGECWNGGCEEKCGERGNPKRSHIE